MGVMLGYSIPLLFLTLFATANPFNSAVHGGICTESKKSTLLIVFGDSFFDVGYGNEELCLPSKGQPHGKSLDLQQVAPGRFSDGLLLPDYIAKHLGLDNNGRIASYKQNLGIVWIEGVGRRGKGRDGDGWQGRGSEGGYLLPSVWVSKKAEGEGDGLIRTPSNHLKSADLQSVRFGGFGRDLSDCLY
ncbi:hypothetical protein SLEP1_g39654 [Rubroshorea leprosula]|uniref:GDSL esterase/lipase n=1 Tax=Rubroshorea leprosula TaxID=152421 RepID=A0AAV5L0X0_9ROSI|nr:hypothetical protein SLEP1_g39654 [Rubroshorea leprosula]